MLNAYLAATQALLQLPPAPTTLYPTTTLTTFINTGRGQVAGEGECIRFMATLPVVQGQQVINFSDINVNTVNTGIQGVIHVRTVWLQAGVGQIWLRPRSFEWFSLYELNNAAPQPGPPKIWSQFGQGASGNETSAGATSSGPGGTVYLSPVPDSAYTLMLDCVCYPIPLTADVEGEAIPYLWTDAVPYFAAYLALLSAQSAQRQGDANRMFERYTEFMNRARRFSTPDVLPGQYPQNANVTRPNQLGMSPPSGPARGQAGG
jgi:hypothetical protein